MSTDQAASPADAEAPASPAPGRSARWRLVSVVLAAALVLALGGLALVWAQGSRGAAEDSPAVGFARDMYGHHGQAVTMAMLVREQGSDPRVAAFAEEVITSQAEQQGVMVGWLHEQGVPATSTQAPMAWMDGAAMGGHSSGHEGMGDAAAMTPEQAREAMGMASDTQLAELGRATGTAADLLFVQLMTPHHEGAVEMAEAFLAMSDEPQMTWLAEAVVTGQERELRILADLEADLAADLSAQPA